MSDPETDAPALDPRAVDELRRLQVEWGNPHFFEQLVGIFTTNAPRRMERLRQAVAGREAQALEHTAHTLKSNCAMLGATRMAAHCHELEKLGERGGFEQAAVVLSRAEEEFTRVLAALQALGPASPDA